MAVKYPTPPQKGLEFPRGGVVSKTKTFKDMYQASCNVQRGGGGGEVWILGGTTQYTDMLIAWSQNAAYYSFVKGRC